MEERIAIAANRRIANASARNAVTGPWVTVNGPAASGNTATSKIERPTNSANSLPRSSIAKTPILILEPEFRARVVVFLLLEDSVTHWAFHLAAFCRRPELAITGNQSVPELKPAPRLG